MELFSKDIVTITGKVLNYFGKPAQNVVVENQTTGFGSIVSGTTGYFTINANVGDVLKFQATGSSDIVEKTVTIGTSYIEVTLDDTEDLGNVVIENPYKSNSNVIWWVLGIAAFGITGYYLTKKQPKKVTI